MKHSWEFVLAGVVALIGGILATGNDATHRWKIKRSDSPSTVHFIVERSQAGNHWSNSQDVPLARFRNFSRDQLDRGGSAKFEYVHDAGRLICEGSFRWSEGVGNYTFAPSAEFVADLKRLGYETPDEEMLFSMLMSDVTLEYANGVAEAGLEASTQQLVDLRNHGVTLDYIRTARKAGYKSLDIRNLIEMRNHGVSAEFMRELKSFDYDLEPRDLVELRNHGVSSDYMKELKDSGYEANAREITELRNQGVESSFIKDATELGYSFSTKDLVDLRNHGVNGSYLKKLKDAGMRDLNASQIAKLRDHGVE